MFTTFLLGTLLVSVLMLTFLLLLPARSEPSQDRFPYAGMALALVMAAIAFIGGLAVIG